jgi:hypothetical protein
MRRFRSGVLARTLAALGALMLLAGLAAGLVNRELLDGDRFAGHVDAIRQDPQVARAAALRITDELLEREPDLLVARPLVESVLQSLVASPVFGPVVRAAVVPVHALFTSEDAGQPVLVLADVGALLTAAVRAASPGTADRIDSRVDVTLAGIGDREYAETTLRAARHARLLSWLLPLLALASLALAVAVHPSRLRALRDVGAAVLAVGVAGLLAAAVATVLAATADPDTLTGAVAVAGWHELDGRVWLGCAAVAALGYITASAAARAQEDQEQLRAGLVGWLRDPSTSPRSLALHGVLLVVLAVVTLLRPQLVVTATAVAVALLMLGRGVQELFAARVATRSRRGSPTRQSAGRTATGAVAAAALGLALLAGLAVFGARPPDRLGAAGVDLGACNGRRELCDRRYSDVAFVATHNSMAAADEPGWYRAEQPTGVMGQLHAGVRVFLIDSWYGQQTERPGVVATAGRVRESANRQARAEYGGAVVEKALRVRDALRLEPTGPVEPYLCHDLCELGSTLWQPLMEDVATWMEQNPREVVTFLIQDVVTPEDTADLFADSGLTKYVFEPRPGEEWPTLGEMVSSGQRLVVLMENNGGGTAVPWLLQGFTWVQDTPFDFATVDEFSCEPFRGSPDSPLFLVNHWVNQPRSRVSVSQEANSADVLGDRLRTCEQERGMVPNFVAVDFYDLGDVFDQVDLVNGLG